MATEAATTTATLENIPSFGELATSVNEAAAKGGSVEIKPSDLMGTKPAQKPEAAKEQPKPETKAEAKPDTKTETKPEKVAEDADDHTKLPEYKSANAKLRAVLDKVAKERNEFKTKATEAETIKAKIGEYEAKIKALESKPVETKTDTALIEKYEAEIKKREQQIRELDYAKSAEFSDKFIKPLQKTYKTAIEEVTQLTVADGENNRNATQADFDTLRNLPLAQRRTAARQMFGQDADLVLGHIRDIEKIQKDANESIENEKLNGETRLKEQKLRNEREQGEYEGLLKTFQDEIAAEYADLFQPGDDKEAADALQKGFEFVDAALKNTAGMTLKERAAYNAVLRAKAAAFPVQAHKLAKITAERDSLLEELKKYRDADPGNGGGKPPAEKPKEEDLSIAALTSKFNNMD